MESTLFLKLRVSGQVSSSADQYLPLLCRYFSLLYDNLSRAQSGFKLACLGGSSPENFCKVWFFFSFLSAVSCQSHRLRTERERERERHDLRKYIGFFRTSPTAAPAGLRSSIGARKKLLLSFFIDLTGIMSCPMYSTYLTQLFVSTERIQCAGRKSLITWVLDGTNAIKWMLQRHRQNTMSAALSHDPGTLPCGHVC